MDEYMISSFCWIALDSVSSSLNQSGVQLLLEIVTQQVIACYYKKTSDASPAR